MNYFSASQNFRRGYGNILYALFLLTTCLLFVSPASARDQGSSCVHKKGQSAHYRYHCRFGKKDHRHYRDRIVVAEGEVIQIIESDTDNTVVALEGGRRDSTIINRGEVSVSVANIGGESRWRRRFVRSLRRDNWMSNTDRISPDAVAIAGGDGDDIIKNHGLLSASSITNLIDEPGISQSYSIGITGNDGEDRIVNLGQLNVTSDAKVETSDLTVSLVDSGDAQRQAFALAKGITGDDDEDTIINKGQMNVTANATVDSSAFNISLIGGAVDVDAASEAWAGAIGIDSGDGGDRIKNQGTLTVIANAVAESDDVSVDLLGIPEAGSVQAPLIANASAIGIYGAGGDERDDLIRNTGTLNVTANARADALNVNVSGVRLSGEGANTASEATAVGIAGSTDFDDIVNQGDITVEANANTRTDTVGVTILDLSLIPGFFGAENQQVTTTATSVATGIASGDGDDRIKNNGQLSVTSNARLDQFSLSLDLLSGPTDIDGGNEVQANATGIDGGEGEDRIHNSNSLNVTTDARVNVLDLDLSAINLSSADMSTASSATTLGIDGGKENSLIRNSGDMEIGATATTDVKSFSFTLVDLTLIPDAINLITGTPGADTSTTATADATGIKTGDDSDKIVNNGGLSVTADAITKTFDMSMSADGVSNFTELDVFPDFFLNEPVIDASTKAEASVTGITSGHGNDDIINKGTLFAKATAGVTATSIGVDLPLPDLLPQILPNIDTTEVATEARSSAIGITTGEGHDWVKNDGGIWSEAIANANSLSVNATIGIPVPGLIDYNIPYAIEANLVDVGATSETESVGLDTGKGYDDIASTGDITAKAVSNATATNIAATVAYADDKVSFGLSLANASTEAKATATGIDTGSSDDWLHNTGDVLADSFADTNSTAVTVKLQAIKDTIVGIGASATRANSEAETVSTGIQLGDGDDDVVNEGSITAKSHNTVDAVAVDVGITIPTGDNFGIIGEGTWVTADTIAKSSADGITGGEGRDYISNSGTVVADAWSRPNSVGVAANASGTKKGASIGIALTQANTEGSATSHGISGGDDEDWLVNTGTVKSKAKTDTVAASVTASLALTDKGVALTGTAADGSTKATSTAHGINGDEEEDFVDNKGTVDVFADANAVSGSVSVSAQGANKGVALGLALSRATSDATADSQGISGGLDDDDLSSSGTVKSHAKALVIGGSLAVAGGGTSKGLTVEGAAADGSTTGKVTAGGISGDQGDDTIVNEGSVDVLADADATSVSVGVTANGTGTGVTIGIALARATSEAEAESRGIEGGQGDDDISSSGTVKSHANSLVIAGSGALAAGGAGKGVSAQGVGVDAQTSGLSDAQGLSGGEGKDRILVEEAVDVFADTSTTSIGVAVTANGTGTGLTFGLGLARAGAEGEAISHGINGGEDDDILLSNQLIKSHAKSLVIAGSGGLAVGGTGKGVTITGAAVDAASVGDATAKGVSGDTGKDLIVNQDMVDVFADVDTTSAGLAVAANGTGAGVSLGIGLARATTIANADSSGISGGENDDQILNNGLVKSHATSDVIAGSAGLAGGFAAKGVSISGAAADASTLGNARATGISGDLGLDKIFNQGDLDVLADSAATSVSVGAAASFTAAGVGLGVSLARTDTKSDATATGISLGGEADVPEEDPEPKWKKHKYTKAGMKGCRSKHGHRKYHSRWKRHKHCGGHKPEPTETVVNNGKITSEAIADADSVSVSVQVGFTGAGVQAGGALADASTRATAASMGIEGSGHKDIIVNQNSIDSIAGADATTTSVGVTFNAGVKSLTLSAALTDATANANASSIGIAGLGGDDKIGSSGAISATSTADTNAVAVSVPISLSIVPLSAAFADADAKASADANAINGGVGNDYLENSGVLLADANSNADGISVSVAPIGVALVGANITAEANAVGIEGASGDDVIFQKETASLSANSEVTATGTTIAATVLGVAGGFDNKSTAISQSTGISGGAGNNKTVNLGSISTDASSEATGTSVSAALTGVTIANTTTIATTHSTGISGGEDQDLILNQGSILVRGNSKTTGTSVGASVDPVSFADTTSTSITHGNGISGGEGDDDIINLGSIDVGGSSTAKGTSVGVALRYAAFADASTSSTANSSGISGDAGLDNLLNLGSIKSKANSTATGTSVSAGLAGATFADSNTDATSYSTGISAGAGLDKILNLGSIQSEANSTAKGTSVSATLVGASFADLASSAESNAIGIAAGAGEDKLLNKAGISAVANATANGTSVAAGLAGFFDGDASTEVTANAMGIDLGSGDDAAFSEGAIAIAANSNSKVTTGTGALAGAALAKVNTTSNVAATGIDGGEGKDLIINKGSITIGTGSVADPWMSSLTSTSFSLAVLGAAIAESSLFAKTESIGIDGGAGDDRISNAGDLNIAATSYSTSTNTSIGIFGAAGSDGKSGAITEASGIAGGDGNDEIENMNLINVNSNTFAGINGSSFTFAGGSSNEGALTAEGKVMGISAGTGDDQIDNKGQIKINTKANLRITGGSKVIFGVASADSTTSADLLATGIDTDAGNDLIKNSASIDVTSNAITTSNRTAYAFAGGSNVSSMLSAKSRSKGINSGLGDDEVFNAGNITVNSISSLTATGGTSSSIAGSAVSAATVSASSQLSGIETGGGNDQLFNIANITGTTNSNSSSINDANAGTFFSDGITRSTATTSSNAYGMNAGSGDNLVINKGNLLISTIGKANANSKSDGDIIDNILGIDQDAFATSSASVSRGEAVGIFANDGLNQVANLGNITINLTPQAFSTSNANGDAIISGDGTANATSRADNMKAYGMKFGNGNNWIKNSGTITVKTKPRINAATYSDADGVGEFREPDSRANSYAYANNALAVGIWSGEGNNTVINDGILNVESAPNADKADAFADFGGDVLGIDAFARATARANNAQSYGIRVGNGNNVILNDGSLLVASRPRAVVRAFANAVGFDGDASAWANANANNALAVGIRAGNGNNMVFNNGVINVTAAPYAFADGIASPGSNILNDGEAFVEENATTSNARAYGILTGSGDDYILNKGTIIVNATGSSPTEVAIHSGAGNDIVDLADASNTTGAIELGANDDTLHIINTPVVNGRISGGSGIDTVVYDGEGTFNNVLEPDFENVVKQGAGTYILPALPSMENIAIEAGLLEIESNYQLAAGSSIMPSVSSGVGQGSLVINGALDISQGKIDIVIGSGHHIDGDRQSVLSAAEGIVNSLSASNITLPEPSPLLAFYDEITTNELKIKSSVKPFNTVATSRNEKAIADYMDDLLPEAEGDVSVALGEIQVMQAGEHASAFSSLNPESYVNSQQALAFGVKNYMSTLQQRTRGLRHFKDYDDFIQPGFLSVESTGEYAYQSAASLPEILALAQSSYQPYGSWTKSQLQNGQLNQTVANSGFDFNSSGYSFGYDQRLDDHRIVGFSLANNTTSLTADDNRSRGNIESQLVSVYGSYANQTGYFEALVSSGHNYYDSGRTVSIGSINSGVSSEHSGNIFSATMGAGLFMPVTSWDVEAYGALHYQRQEEDGFQEEGAGGIGLDVKSRDSNLLSSELGFRFARLFAGRQSKLFTEFGIAWLHELEDDRSIEVSFVDTPDSTFNIDAQDIDDDGISMSAGLKYLSRNGVIGSAEFRTEIRDDYSDEIVSGSIQYQFD